jgi:hypothetical protein
MSHHRRRIYLRRTLHALAIFGQRQQLAQNLQMLIIRLLLRHNFLIKTSNEDPFPRSSKIFSCPFYCRAACPS